MKIFLAGATGFIGNHLSAFLAENGHSLTLLTRRKKESSLPQLTYLPGNPMEAGDWQQEIHKHDAVINLTGASIFCRWTEKNKNILTRSRVVSTRNIVDGLAKNCGHVKMLVNASAVGYYGDTGEIEIDESSPPGDDFLAALAQQWENEATKAEKLGISVIRTRFGVVLGSKGGALDKMIPAFKLGVGSPLGSGEQWFPWIHIIDLCRIFLFLLEEATISGPVNCCSPQQVTNRQFTHTLARQLHRPVLLPAVPAFVLRIVLGETADIVLGGQKVVPKVLEEKGFKFTYAALDQALADILSSS